MMKMVDCSFERRVQETEGVHGTHRVQGPCDVPSNTFRGNAILTNLPTQDGVLIVISTW